MAQDVNRFMGPGADGSYTYHSVGNAEDLYDILINLDPVRTKFLSAFGTAEDAISTNFSWFTERLRPAQDNAHLEKEEYSFKEIDSQEGLTNYIQHFQNSHFITDTQNRIKKAFRRGSTEFDAAVDHAIRGQREDIELMLVSSATANFETPGSVPARSGGVPYFMRSNSEAATVDTSNGVVTLTDVSLTHPIDLKTGDFVYFTAETMPDGLESNRVYYIRIEDDAEVEKNKFKLYYSLEQAVAGVDDTNIVPTSEGTDLKMEKRNIVSLGGTDEFTLDDINTVLEMIYRRGGNGNQLYMSLRNKRRFSKLVVAEQVAQRDPKEMAQLNDAATYYESDFGNVTAHAHHLYPDTRLDILDMQYWDMKWLRRTHEVDGLAKTGTYEKFVIESDCGLQATAPQASGAIVDIKV